MSEQNRDTALVTSEIHNKTLFLSNAAIFVAIWYLTGALLNALGPSVTPFFPFHLDRASTVSAPRTACTTATFYFGFRPPVDHYPTLACSCVHNDSGV